MRKNFILSRSRRGAIILGGFGGGTIVGKFGNMVGQRNPYGNMLRARVLPVNPNTLKQQVVRTAFQQLSYTWSNTLTNSQRLGWDSYAAGTVIITKRGTSQVLSGRAMFIRTNMTPYLNGSGVQATSPSTPGEAVIPTVSVSAVGSTGIPTIGSVNTADTTWILQVLYSRFWGSAKRYFSGPYVFTAAASDGDTFPLALPAIAPTGATGDRVFFQFRYWNGDENKVTSYFRTLTDAT